MAYSMESVAADCYEGTTCLINKLDIHDEDALAEFVTSIIGPDSYAQFLLRLKD